MTKPNSHSRHLHFADLIHLSLINITSYKARSLLIFFTTSVLFGAVMTFNFILGGLEKSAIEAQLPAEDAPFYVSSYYDDPNHPHNHYSEYAYSIDEIPAHFEVPKSQSDLAHITERAAQFNGRVVGEISTYQFSRPYPVITAEVVSQYLKIDPSKTPTGKVPVVMPEHHTWADFFDPTTNAEDLAHAEEIFYIIGTIPDVSPVNSDSDKLQLPGANLLNYPLSLISAGSSTFYIVNDDQAKIDAFLRSEAEYYIKQGRSVPIEATDCTTVLAFENYHDAMRYAFPPNFLGINLSFKHFPFYSGSLFNGIIATASNFSRIKNILAFFEILLLIVAIIIATMTFIHLLDHDAATVAIYRSMGASNGQIYLIYFCYLLELCLFSIISAILLAYIIIGILALFNLSDLSQACQIYFGLSQPPTIHLFRFDQYFWVTIIAILLIAPITLACSSHALTSQHINKQLHKDT